ncbi:MAG: bifunctional folylpolyglutamate synthase/dihydrofolate synthase, partial [Burkholderiales bacterium]|nr:bifunctional folylpolyglutamate synthase/dihydrofolate synthase [Burkholderiales bacterium]
MHPDASSATALAAWLARLERQHPVAIDLGLERVGRVRDAMHLVLPMPVITVGGTNGKGSTCAMLAAMLVAAGWRTGVYTSPHLVHYRERVRLPDGFA